MIERLREPLPRSVIKQRQGPGGKSLSYITARCLMERLDTLVGPQNWQTRYHEVAGKVCCELGIRIDGEWIWKADGAGETSIEGEKGSFSDAFKRAGVAFGFARELYPDALEARRGFDAASPYSNKEEEEMSAREAERSFMEAFDK